MAIAIYYIVVLLVWQGPLGPEPLTANLFEGCWAPECTRPSHSQSLANLVANVHLQGPNSLAKISGRAFEFAFAFAAISLRP